MSSIRYMRSVLLIECQGQELPLLTGHLKQWVHGLGGFLQVSIEHHSRTGTSTGEPRVPETQVLRASYPAKDSRKNPTGQMEGSVFQQFEIRWRWHNSRKHQNQSVFTQTSVLVSLSHWLLFLFSSPFLINAICLFTIAACCGTCMATRVCLWRLTKDPHSTCLPSHDSDYTPPATHTQSEPHFSSPHSHQLLFWLHMASFASYHLGLDFSAFL